MTATPTVRYKLRPMSPQFELSVVTPTYNRKESLRRTLAALERQTVDPKRFEVVVIDDGSKDGTPEAFRDAKYPFSLRLVACLGRLGVPARRVQPLEEVRLRGIA